MSRNPDHQMLARPSHDERARQDFVGQLKLFSGRTVRPLNREVFRRQAAPAWEAEHGRPPETEAESSEAMHENLQYRSWSALQRATQEQMWGAVSESLEREEPRLKQVYHELTDAAEKCGSLELDPHFEVPAPIDRFAIHLQPGTYALNRGKLRGGRRSYDPPSIVIVGAIAGLGLILLGQFVHNSRQSLATYGVFNATIAPVYRLLGSPITPDWDARAWQFEATNGSVDEEETTLTIVSRIANRSDQPLPYPLVHVSLTNRFEDIMGSRILEPGQYLAGAGDPSQPVEPGENFTAVVTIDDPSVDATGFKLNVCYRVRAGTVRCAIEDFKKTWK